MESNESGGGFRSDHVPAAAGEWRHAVILLASIHFVDPRLWKIAELGALFGHACHLRLRIEGMHRSSSLLLLFRWLARRLGPSFFSALRVPSVWATESTVIVVKRPPSPSRSPRFLAVFSPFTTLVFWTSMPIHTLYDVLYHDDPRLVFPSLFAAEKEQLLPNFG